MRALISVSDKTNVVEFAKELEKLGYEIISTSGTMKMLREAGVLVTSVSDVTGFPEICDGRVKTLHPKIHGGLLARRDLASHKKDLDDNDISYIDLVCVNLYPFAKTIANPNHTLEDAIENIDIGGPSMLRSAAKNYASVTVLCDPADYAKALEQIKENGNTTFEFRQYLAYKVFTHTANYDTMISSYLAKVCNVSDELHITASKVCDLRYGENPHQKAAFYQSSKNPNFNLSCAKQLNGKELSYNNIQDANAALSIVKEFRTPFCVALKHMNPCGAAIADDGLTAWRKAYEADTTSIFGGIVATNCEITKEMALEMKAIFLEVIMAPKFSDEALKVLCKKKNVRLLEVSMNYDDTIFDKQIVSVCGGYLVQDFDSEKFTNVVKADMCVTDVKPTNEEISDMNFAWRIVKHVKSNAIVIAKNGQTLGIGAGQMNRIGSAHLAIEEAHALGFKSDLIMASDGFFPFDDCVKYAHENGVKAIVQPGGSVRDEDSIKAANEFGISMLFTGMRHFKH